MKKYKYSIWTFEHESIYYVRAIKIKDTNSSKEVDKYMLEGYGASFYREENDLNAQYLQTFTEE